MSVVYICNCCKKKEQVSRIDENGKLISPEGWIEKYDKKFVHPWNACSLDCAKKIEERHVVKFDETT